MRSLILVALTLMLPMSAAIASPVTSVACMANYSPEFSAVIPLSEGGRSGYLAAESPAETPFEVHVVGSYEGSGRVLIKPTDKPVVLFLSSYESSRWQIELADGARLDRVLIQGYKPSQLVTGLPDGVSPENVGPGHSAYKWQDKRSDTQYMTKDFKHFIADVRCKTGQVETSFQGSYDLGDDFTVPPIATGASAIAIENPGEPRSAAVLNANATLEEYASDIASVPEEFHRAGEILLSLMKAGKLPVFFPDGDSGHDASAPAVLRKMWFPSLTSTTNIDAELRECLGRENAAFTGTPAAETFACAWGDQWYALGAGGDVVSDSCGDDVFIAGAGDQIFNMGWGNDVAVFQSGWGSAVIDKTCHDSSMTQTDEKRLNWHFERTNFLIFGPNLYPAEFVWTDDKTLTYSPTGDRLVLINDCFTLVFSEAGPQPIKQQN